MGHNFKELKIWNNAMDVVALTYDFSSLLPQNEKYSFISQINRSALSIPSNIAEGSGRNSNKDFSRFIDISLSSSFELETQLLLAHRLFGIENSTLLEKLNELQKMIVGFRKTLNTKV